VTTFILKNSDIKKNYLGFFAQLPEHKIWEIRIKEHKKDLTGQQRNYFHKCVDVISDYTGDTPEDIKLRLKYATLPLRDVVVGTKTYMVPVSTESLGRNEYSQLIDAVLILGQNLGLTMPTAQFYGYEV
jgi:hypothetical protein